MQGKHLTAVQSLWPLNMILDRVAIRSVLEKKEYFLGGHIPCAQGLIPCSVLKDHTWLAWGTQRGVGIEPGHLHPSC